MSSFTQFVAVGIVPLLFISFFSTANAKTPEKNDIKKIAVIGAAMAAIEKAKPKTEPPKQPEIPKPQIPGVPAEEAPKSKKEAKKAEKEKAQTVQETAQTVFKYITDIAQNGDAQAQYILGLAYYSGQQIKSNDALAVR